MTLDVGLMLHIVYRKSVFFMYYWCCVFIWLLCDGDFPCCRTNCPQIINGLSLKWEKFFC